MRPAATGPPSDGESGSDTGGDTASDSGGYGMRFDVGDLPPIPPQPPCDDPSGETPSACDPQPQPVEFTVEVDDVTAALDDHHPREPCTVSNLAPATGTLELELDCQGFAGHHVHAFVLTAEDLRVSGIDIGGVVSLELDRWVFDFGGWPPGPGYDCPQGCITAIVRDTDEALVLATLIGPQEDRFASLVPLTITLDLDRCFDNVDACWGDECRNVQRLGVDIGLGAQAMSVLDGSRIAIGSSPTYDIITREARRNFVNCTDTFIPDVTLEMLIVKRR